MCIEYVYIDRGEPIEIKPESLILTALEPIYITDTAIKLGTSI